MKCPKCVGKLQEKNIEVEEIREDGKDKKRYYLTVDQCFVCGGVWFDKGELNRYNRSFFGWYSKLWFII